MFTSMYRPQHGVISREKLSQSVETLAKILRAHGYQTLAATEGLFLTRHFGLEHGFDLWPQENQGRCLPSRPASSPRKGGSGLAARRSSFRRLASRATSQRATRPRTLITNVTVRHYGIWIV